MKKKQACSAQRERERLTRVLNPDYFPSLVHLIAPPRSYLLTCAFKGALGREDLFREVGNEKEVERGIGESLGSRRA